MAEFDIATQQESIESENQLKEKQRILEAALIESEKKVKKSPKTKSKPKVYKSRTSQMIR